MKKKAALLPHLPKRKSLGEQVADLLRDSLQNAVWKEVLPAERSLCKMADVSRPILREALHLMQKEGWIEVRQGRPSRILHRSTRRLSKSRSDRVVMLFSESFRAMNPWVHVLIDEVRISLGQQGRWLDLVSDVRLRQRSPAPLLKHLVKQYESSHWILSSLSQPVQEWFQRQSLNAIVSGHAFPGIELPSVDDDLKGVSRHAAGILLGMGHSRVIFLTRISRVAGLVAAEMGVAEAFQASHDGVCHIVKHGGEADEIRAKLKAVLGKVPRATAILVSHGIDVLVVIQLLLEMGVRVPLDLSIHSILPGYFMERIRPEPARYEMDARRHALAICRLINRPPRHRKTFRLIPNFIRGQTLHPVLP